VTVKLIGLYHLLQVPSLLPL